MTTSLDKKSNSRSAWPHVRKSNKKKIILEQKYHYNPSPDSLGHYGAYNLVLIINKAQFFKFLLFLKGMIWDCHGYPALRHIELVAVKRQQLPPQSCTSLHTDEQQQSIHFAMLFFLCWQHHNCVSETPNGILGAASAAEKNNISHFPSFSLFIERQFTCVKRARRKGTRMYCHLLFTPTYLPSFSVYSLKKNRHKNNLRRGKDEIRHRDARKEIFPRRLKEMLKTSGKGKIWKVSTGLSFFYPNLTFPQQCIGSVQCPAFQNQIQDITLPVVPHCHGCDTYLAIRTTIIKGMYTLQYKPIYNKFFLVLK